MNKITTLLLAALLLLSAQAFSQKNKKDDPKHYLDTLGIGLTWRSVGPAVTSWFDNPPSRSCLRQLKYFTTTFCYFRSYLQLALE